MVCAPDGIIIMNLDKTNYVRCIFCCNPLDIESVPPEHIIPESIGGKKGVTIKNVCASCNHKLGSAVDSGLNRQRHIFDGFKEIPVDQKPSLEFWFKDRFYIDNLGRKVKYSKSYKKSRGIPTRIGDELIIDPEDKKTIKKLLLKAANYYDISSELVQKELDRLEKFNQRCKDNDQYKGKYIPIKIRISKHQDIKISNMMEGETPHRFVAKACVEFAYGLGIEKKIRNLDSLKKHARFGDQIDAGTISLWQEIRPKTKALPVHIIKFAKNQFHFYFFAKYVAAVNIVWEGDPCEILVAYDIPTGNLLQCDEDESSGKAIAYKNKIIKLKKY